jgi:hypothetical protein
LIEPGSSISSGSGVVVEPAEQDASATTTPAIASSSHNSWPRFEIIFASYSPIACEQSVA